MKLTDSIDELTERIIACAIAVHTTLGPGLLESIYLDCLTIELVAAGLRVERNRSVPVMYRGQRVRDDLKLDLVVEGCIVIEVKAVDRLHPVHLAQLITYLKLTGFPAGLLMNFNATTLCGGLKRVDHPDRYAAQHARPVPPKAE
jgi:GxxExxY protein